MPPNIAKVLTGSDLRRRLIAIYAVLISAGWPSPAFG
jgi:hypothetical protein